nr:FUSC family protein [Actinopolymorpha pittospori]
MIVIAVLAFLLPYGINRNYGLFTVFLTPLIVVLIDLLEPDGWQLAEARLFDTVLGCAVVLVLGFALWPSSWYAHVGPQFADGVSAISHYLGQAFGEDAVAVKLHTQAYSHLSDLRAVFQRALAEPAPVSRHVTSWYPAVVACAAACGRSQRAIRALTRPWRRRVLISTTPGDRRACATASSTGRLCALRPLAAADRSVPGELLASCRGQVFA